MLPKKNRISKKEFGELLKNSKRYNTDHFLFYLAKNKATYTKFAVSVSKKVCRRAVDRNKIRRRGYSVISKKIGQLKTGYSGLFVAKAHSLDLKFNVLEEEINALLLKSGVII